MSERQHAERRPAPRRGPARAILVVLVAQACALALGLGFRLLGASEASTVLLFLLAVATVAYYAGRLASIAAAVLAVLLFNFFFTRPVLTMAVDDLEYLFTFAVLLVTGLLISGLVGRLRDEAARVAEQAAMNRLLYRVGSEIMSTSGARAIAERACMEIRQDGAGAAVVFLTEGVALRGGVGAEGLTNDPIEFAAAEAALRDGEAGRGTSRVPEARSFHVVLPSPSGPPLGTLGLTPQGPSPTRSERRLVHALAAQLALALQRERHAVEAQRTAVEVEAERLRSNLLSSVSHDLRTPLATISGSASTMLELDGALPAEERRELCREILSESMRLTRTVENLLQLGRVEEGRVRLAKDWFPIEEIIEASLAQVGRLGDTAGILVELPAEPPLVFVDADLLVSLIVNLLDNALRYAPSGSIAVVIERAPDAVHVTVRDEGPGLPAGDPEVLFDRFVRGPHAAGVTGSGLGLTICRAIALAHGGTLEASAGPDGVGAAFRLSLPVLGPSPVDELLAPTFGEAR